MNESNEMMDSTAIVYCPICKRPVLPQLVDWDKKTAFCDGCQYSFSLETLPERRRAEIVIPKGVKNIRLSLSRNELTVKVRWIRNYRLDRLPQRNADEDDMSNAFMQLQFLFKLTAFLINRTIVRATPEYVWIEHKPIDSLPSVFFHARQIDQLFVRQTRLPGALQGMSVLTLQLKNGEQYDILWDLRLDVLLYLEQEIERLLGIEDREMPGEIV